jgi:hypothetical protein
MKHGEENNILYPLQHGFRKGHSCETQLIEFVDGISKNLQEGQQTDIPILDFAKAFDKVNHSLLIHKLQHYGIIGKFNCFSNFVIPLQVISKDFIFGCCVVVEFIRFEFRNSSMV